MNKNLLRETWTNLDSFELRLFLDNRIGGPGQTDRERSRNPNTLYLPLARSFCRRLIPLSQVHQHLVLASGI
jgi:hypothetical protein